MTIKSPIIEKQAGSTGSINDGRQVTILADTLSHEFRTPLSVILSSANLIARYSSLENDVDRQRHTTIIKDQVQKLNRIVDRLVTLCKMGDGALPVKNTLLAVEDLVSKWAMELNDSLGNKRFISGQSSNAVVKADEDLLKAAWMLVADNALAYSTPNTSIKYEAYAHKGQVLLTIANQGAGIPEADQPYIFKRFYRGSNATGKPGDGLGLHLAQQYLQAMGGSITFESSYTGGGTVFTLSVPEYL